MYINNNIFNVLNNDLLFEIIQYLNPHELTKFVIEAGKKSYSQMKEVTKRYRHWIATLFGTEHKNRKIEDAKSKHFYKKMIDLIENKSDEHSIPTMLKEYQELIHKDRFRMINGIRIKLFLKPLKALKDAEEWLNSDEAKSKFANIKHLSLSNTAAFLDPKDTQGFKHIPGDIISKLPELQTLYLYGHQLKTLPEELSGLEKLKRVDCRNNPIRSIPSILKDLYENGGIILDKNKKPKK